MGSIAQLPKSATLREEFAGRVNKPDAWTHGKVIRFSRYSAYCSKGYKSDYTQVPTEFLVLRIEGERTRCTSYSGKRIEYATKIFSRWESDLLPHLESANTTASPA